MPPTHPAGDRRHSSFPLAAAAQVVRAAQDAAHELPSMVARAAARARSRREGPTREREDAAAWRRLLLASAAGEKQGE